jgi:aspartyl/glutamyl-tRNA(Asn/Gln) amidotransferase C subunit
MGKKIDPRHLAKLTNISLSDAESTTLTQQFSDTLNTISTLNELNTANIKATPQVTNLHNVFRDDIIDTSRMFTQTQALANATKTHQGYFVVEAVINET